ARLVGQPPAARRLGRAHGGGRFVRTRAAQCTDESVARELRSGGAHGRVRAPYGPEAPESPGAVGIRGLEDADASGPGTLVRRPGPPGGGRRLASPIRPHDIASSLLRHKLRPGPGGVSRLSDACGPLFRGESLLL